MLFVTSAARAVRETARWRPAVNAHLRRRREFHLDAQDAVRFLAEHAPGSVRASVGKKDTQQEARGTQPSLSVLLHADRRPQSLRNKAHYGPTLIGCATNVLPKTTNAEQYGRGDVGLVQWSERRPKECCVRPISIEQGLRESEAIAFAETLGVKGQQIEQWAKGLMAIWSIFTQCEGVYFTFTVSPSQDGPLTLLNPFLEFDDFAIHRVPALQPHYACRTRDENSAKAEDGGLFYIKLPTNDANVGSFGYGAGNAMATMDGLALVGGRPANFLDGGGGANKANAKLAIETLNRDPDVRSIFVNTFGGITQTDVVAEGIIEAVREHQMDKPITVRVLGTGAERAKELLAASKLGFSIEDDFKTAAKAAVERASNEDLHVK